MAIQAVNPFGNLTAMTLEQAIEAVINAALLLIGLAALIALILGGVRYISSLGDEQSAEKAKKTILYAVVGIIAVGLSYAVVTYVFSALTAASGS